MADATTQQLEREIADLEATMAEVEQKLRALFADYVNALAAAARQQVVMAAYRLCTRDYPSQFLALPLGERQRLQQELQAVATAEAQQLATKLSALEPDTWTERETFDRLLGKALEAISERANDLLRVLWMGKDGEGDDPQERARIHLRASEIEFSDRAVMAKRGEMQVLAARLRQYQSMVADRRKAKQIAEADLAWRATWIDIDSHT